MLRTRPKLEANYPTDPVTGLPDYEAAPTWLPDSQKHIGQLLRIVNIKPLQQMQV